MKPMLLLAFGLASLCRADDAADRAAIEKIMPVLTRPEDRAAVIADSADVRAVLERIDSLATSAPPWSELRPPSITTEDIRFVTSDVALIDAHAGREGMRTIRFIAVLRRDAGRWRIVAMRITAVPLAFAARMAPAETCPLPPARPA
jgi:hypothetical protein